MQIDTQLSKVGSQKILTAIITGKIFNCQLLTIQTLLHYKTLSLVK